MGSAVSCNGFLSSAFFVGAVDQTGDLSETFPNETSTKILHAFRGAATSDAGIAQFSNTRDERLRTILRNAFEEIAKAYKTEGAYLLARDATFGLLARLEGMRVALSGQPNRVFA